MCEKLLLAALSASLALYSTIGFSKELIFKNPRIVTKYVPKKVYKIPGSSAVSVARRNGYKFINLHRNSIPDRNPPHSPVIYPVTSCTFYGVHWTVPSKKTCGLRGFQSNNSKCKKLRKGWKVKKISIKGSYVWRTQPLNTENPYFDLYANNAATKAKPVIIQWVELEGPSGAKNKWLEAFNHCSDPNYRE